MSRLLDWLGALLAVGALAALVIGAGWIARWDAERPPPSASVVARCNAQAAAARRDAAPGTRAGGLGALACAGVGAGADLDPRAPARSAALVALLGTSRRGLDGIRDEYRDSLPARVAYRECLDRDGG